MSGGGCGVILQFHWWQCPRQRFFQVLHRTQGFNILLEAEAVASTAFSRIQYWLPLILGDLICLVRPALGFNHHLLVIGTKLRQSCLTDGNLWWITYVFVKIYSPKKHKLNVPLGVNETCTTLISVAPKPLSWLGKTFPIFLKPSFSAARSSCNGRRQQLTSTHLGLVSVVKKV